MTFPEIEAALRDWVRYPTAPTNDQKRLDLLVWMVCELAGETDRRLTALETKEQPIMWACARCGMKLTLADGGRHVCTGLP